MVRKISNEQPILYIPSGAWEKSHNLGHVSRIPGGVVMVVTSDSIDCESFANVINFVMNKISAVKWDDYAWNKDCIYQLVYILDEFKASSAKFCKKKVSGT